MHFTGKQENSINGGRESVGGVAYTAICLCVPVGVKGQYCVRVGVFLCVSPSLQMKALCEWGKERRLGQCAQLQSPECPGKRARCKCTGHLWGSSEVPKSGLLEEVTKLSPPGSSSFKNLVIQLCIGHHRMVTMGLRAPREWKAHILNFPVTKEA